jgi:hypothetical protein
MTNADLWHLAGLWKCAGKAITSALKWIDDTDYRMGTIPGQAASTVPWMKQVGWCI